MAKIMFYRFDCTCDRCRHTWRTKAWKSSRRDARAARCPKCGCRENLDLREHLEALQRLAQTHPRAAQAIVTFTERAAARVQGRARA